jgi:hypothetical protein
MTNRAPSVVHYRLMTKYYSDIPARRARQMVGDIWLVLWSVVWIWAAFKLHDLVMNLAAPGLAIRDGATSLGESIASAGDAIAGVPLVGDSLASPFDGMNSAAMAIADAGAAEAEAVSKLAVFLSVALAVVAIASFAVFWVPIRIAFIRCATAAQKFVDADEDLDLFALRAMSRQPLHLLARISDDPAGAWRRRDTAVVRALAELELRAEGLRPPVAPTRTG